MISDPSHLGGEVREGGGGYRKDEDEGPCYCTYRALPFSCQGLLYLIHMTLSPLSLPAGVHVVLADTPPEEAFAAIAAGSPVMLPCGTVPTDGTQRAHSNAVGSVEVGCF